VADRDQAVAKRLEVLSKRGALLGSPTMNHKSGRAIVERADIYSPKERRR
jgi:hypothetical protein